MKTIATALAAVALAMGLTPKAEAREYCGDRYSSSIYISGRASCGTPIYTERFLVRIDRHGHPVWGYRVLPVSYHSHRYAGYDRGYDRGYEGGHDRRYDRGDRCDDRGGPLRDVRSMHERHRDIIRSVFR